MARSLLLGLLLVAVLVFSSGSLAVGRVETLAAPHAFPLGSWEVRTFLEKWLYKASHLGENRDREPQLTKLHRYFELGAEERHLRDQLRQEASQGGGGGEIARQVQDALEQVQRGRQALRRSVEEFLEGELSAVIRQEGLLLAPLGVRLQFPPVDLRFMEQPRVLVLSPRDRIQLQASYLLKPSMTVLEMEELEAQILHQHNLSALVDEVGGVATYPAAIPTTHELRTALRAAAHEWLHHYLWFFPLGRRYAASPEMRTLNESLADLVGDQLGDALFVRLGGELPQDPSPGASTPRDDQNEVFSFDREMRRTRLQAEALLAQGEVEGAERYLEERRELFVAHGYLLRKLNQAYFAFRGSYADDPASVSPVAQQLRALQKRYTSLGEFVRAVARVGALEEFQLLVEEARGEQT